MSASATQGGHNEMSMKRWIGGFTLGLL